MGIGINSGEVVVGNIGSKKRTKYAAIGSPINKAYRIESYTIGGQILISATTYNKLKSMVHIRGTMKAHFKGIDQAVTLYDVSGIAGKYTLSLNKSAIETFNRIETSLPIRCSILKDKAVSDKTIRGHITHLGESSAQVSLTEKIELYSNIKIMLKLQEASDLSDIYAKVVSIDQSMSDSSNAIVCIEFTWLSQDVKKFLKKIY